MKEKDILKRLVEIECELSPENLHCDGEAPMYYVREKYSQLTKERKKLVKALGREPTFEELFTNHDS